MIMICAARQNSSRGVGQTESPEETRWSRILQAISNNNLVFKTYHGTIIKDIFFAFHLKRSFPKYARFPSRMVLQCPKLVRDCFNWWTCEKPDHMTLLS